MKGRNGETSKLRNVACGFALFSCAFLSPTLARAADIIERRGDDPPVRGEIVEVSDAGVRVRLESGTPRWVSWDRVRSIEVESAEHREQVEDYRTLAEELWRARTRVERRDTALAESILERYFQRFRGQTHETALIVSEGLLRCYLARDARVLAVMPALETARLREAGVKTVSYTLLPDVVDDETMLCPALAPVWGGAIGLTGLERDLASYDAQGNEVIAALAGLYRRAVQMEMNVNVGGSLMRVGMVQQPGVELLRDLIGSVGESSDGRQAARGRLERRLASGEFAEQGAWIEAWARYFVGRSMLGERDELVQKRGLIQLAHLPARFGESQPALAAEALALLIEWHDATDKAEAADSLRSELVRRYPNHPAAQATGSVGINSASPRRISDKKQ